MALKPTAPPSNPGPGSPLKPIGRRGGSPIELQRLLRVDQVADLLGVSERTIFSVTAPRGGLVAIKIGGSLRYHPVDIERYLDSSKIHPE